MSIFTIPYVFKAGMEAIANEVNANFNAIISYLNELQSKYSANDNIITNLPNTYANINGSYNEQFNVKDATLDTHAVNKRQLERYTSNMIMYIYGLVITKDGNSNDTILVSEGQCYSNEVDGERELLELTTQQPHTISDIEASETYNIFIAKDSNDGIHIVSTTDSTPSSTYPYYRLIGTLKTDSSSHIIAETINSMSNTFGGNSKSYTKVNQSISKVNREWKITSNSLQIPDDSSIYIVWVYGAISGTGTGSNRTIETDLLDKAKFLELDHDAGRASYAANIVSVPVSSGSSGYIKVSGSGCKVLGYMRA